jgi:hypothetical protein
MAERFNRGTGGGGASGGEDDEPADRDLEAAGDDDDEPSPTEAAERGRAEAADDSDGGRDVSEIISEGADRLEETSEEAADSVGGPVGDAIEAGGDVGSAVGDAAAETIRSVSEADEAVADAVDEVDESADILAGSADEATARAIESSAEGDVGGVGDAVAGDADEAVSRAIDDVAEGDIGGAGDNLAGGVDETVGQAVETREEVLESNEANSEDVSEAVSETGADDISPDQARAAISRARLNDDTDLTQGGVLDEAQERELRETGQTISSGISETVDRTTDVAFAPGEAIASSLGVQTRGESVGERVAEGAAESALEIGNVPATAASAETSAEVATNLPEALADDAGEVGEQATALARETGEAAARNPARTAGAVLGGAAAGFATGTGAVAGLRRAQVPRRLRREVDATELADEDVVRFFEGDDSGEQFPERDDSLADSPEEAIRRQADEFTPDVVRSRLGDPDDDEAIVQHATDFDFDRSFETGAPKTRPGDPDDVLFAGPEASLNFARLNRGANSGGLSSLRPRLPRGADISDREGDILQIRAGIDREPSSVGDEAATMAEPEQTLDELAEENPDMTREELARESDDFSVGEDGTIFQTTRGEESEFFADEAEPGVGFVRSPENITDEAEVVFGGDTEFVERRFRARRGLFTDVGGDRLNIRFFKPVDDADGSGGIPDFISDERARVDPAIGSLDDFEESFLVSERRGTLGELTRRNRISDPPEGSPFVPAPGGGLSASASDGSGSESGSGSPAGGGGTTGFGSVSSGTSAGLGSSAGGFSFGGSAGFGSDGSGGSGAGSGGGSGAASSGAGGGSGPAGGSSGSGGGGASSDPGFSSGGAGSNGGDGSGTGFGSDGSGGSGDGASSTTAGLGESAALGTGGLSASGTGAGGSSGAAPRPSDPDQSRQRDDDDEEQPEMAFVGSETEAAEGIFGSGIQSATEALDETLEDR